MIISVVIVTYNGAKWVEDCISSIMDSSIIAEVIVIDNASTDHTVSIINNKFPSVSLIKSETNVGFGKANNIGIKKAIDNNSAYIFLLNQDTWIERNTVENLLHVAEQHPEYGILSPMHLLSSQQSLEWHFSTYITPEKCANLYSDIYFNKVKALYEVSFVNAAAWFISRNTIEKIGGFDPLFPHYGEDDDYINRLHYYGLKMAVVPSAIITHDITMKSWEAIKFNKNRQLIFALMELKDIRLSFKYLLFQFLTARMGKLLRLLLLRKWKEFNLMFAVYFATVGKLPSIVRSRKMAKQSHSYL
jgi:GT2 family glycosyltransferase